MAKFGNETDGFLDQINNATNYIQGLIMEPDLKAKLANGTIFDAPPIISET